MTTSDGFCLAALIVLTFPMAYFFVVSPNFFFFRFDDRTVAWVQRGLFNTYFLTMAVCCAIGAVVFAAAGRPAFTVGIGLLGAMAWRARRWFVGEIDAQLRARDAGDTGTASRLRRLHLGGIAYNTVQLAAFLISFPFVFGR